MAEPPTDAKIAARLAGLRTRYPTVEDLEKRARRRVPRFAYDFLQGGAGDEGGIARNRAALSSVEIVPRYGVDVSKVDLSTELFGRRYAAPIGISPIGFDGMLWPGATALCARAAQHLNIPYLTSTMACDTVENVCRWAPDVAWFQLYPQRSEDYRYTFEMAARADAAGAHVLVLTLDIPVRAKRPRDSRHGLTMPFRISGRHIAQALVSPAWCLGIARHGMPRFANLAQFAGPNASPDDTARFVHRNSGGGFPWELVARMRDRWKRPLLVKGVMHPADAERVVALGLEGMIVSNHGGRQFDAAAATIDVLPAIAAAVGDRAKVLVDGGVVSGVDIMKVVACGADAAFSGRAFMLALCALGDLGALHMAGSFIDELKTALGQSGATSLAEVRNMTKRHAGAWKPEDFR